MKTFAYIIFALALVAASVFGAPTGPELVRERLPELYRAWSELAGEAAAQAYFGAWTDREIEFIRAKHRNLLTATAPSMGVILSADRLFDSYGGGCFGATGEVFGNVLMRAGLLPGDWYMDEVEYEALNPDGNKPDGVAYRIESPSLVITGLLESKLGAQSWDRAQAEGFLKRWQHKGITVRTANGPRLFLPAGIRILLGAESQPLVGVGVDELMPITLLIGSARTRKFAGEYVPIPVDATLVREINEYYIRLLHRGRPAPRGSSLLPAPFLEGEMLEDYRLALREYVMERGEWPKSGTPGLGVELARHVCRRGGQGYAFLRDLDGATRHFLARHGTLPAALSLRSQLGRAKPSDPNAISALRAYLRRYEPREPGEPSDIAEWLSDTSAEWKDFFKAQDIDELRIADLTELNDCLSRLVQMSRWQK